MSHLLFYIASATVVVGCGQASNVPTEASQSTLLTNASGAGSEPTTVKDTVTSNPTTTMLETAESQILTCLGGLRDRTDIPLRDPNYSFVDGILRIERISRQLGIEVPSPKPQLHGNSRCVPSLLDATYVKQSAEECVRAKPPIGPDILVCSFDTSVDIMLTDVGSAILPFPRDLQVFAAFLASDSRTEAEQILNDATPGYPQCRARPVGVHMYLNETGEPSVSACR